MQVLGQFNPLAATQSIRLSEIRIGTWYIPVTNHMVELALASFLLAVLVPMAARSDGPVGSRWRILIESICVYLRDQMALPILGPLTDRYIGFIWTTFFFVLTVNLLGLVPSEQITTLLTGRPIHWAGPATANIYVTGALAAVGFLTTHIAGITQHGLIGHLKALVPPGPCWIRPFLFLIELIAVLIRPFTLAIRLFANILAGHIVIATFFGLILVFKNYLVAVAAVWAVVALSMLELLVAFIQAFIFAFLSALYIGFSLSTEH